MKSKAPAEEYYTVQSERLTFRSFTESDIQLWAPFFVDNPTERFLGPIDSKVSKEEKANNWISRQIDRQNNGEFGQLAVILKETNVLIGVGGIIQRELEGEKEFEITYSFLPEMWGNGYATELATFFKNYAFKELEPSSVISIIHKENEASMNVARKNGMEISSETIFMEMPVYIFRVENSTF
jgi:ribosomal-protein-alanine N-acetyltransferase